MPRLVLRMHCSGKIIVGWVEKQDETLRGAGILASFDGFEIRSDDYPQLRTTGFFVRGINREADNELFACACDSKEEARAILATIRKGVQAINAMPLETAKSDVPVFERIE